MYFQDTKPRPRRYQCVHYRSSSTPTDLFEGFTYRHVAKSPMTTFETQYDLLRDLGRGSYGVVKEAVCHATGEHVAVKILKDAKTLRNPNSHPRSHYFRREVGVLRMLEHKNICELKDAFFGENESDNICTYLFSQAMALLIFPKI